MTDNLVTIFEEQVRTTPKNKAVVYRDIELTYEELNRKANSLANSLINDYGISHGDIVPLLLQRDEKIIIAMLAVLKAGACYTALSVDYPKSRIDYVLKQTEAKLIIDNAFFSKAFNENQQNPSLIIDKDDLANIVYTSGTTGNPKGVVHTHKGIVSHIQSYYKFLNPDASSNYNMLFIVNYVFSVATSQIYQALLFGHTLFISNADSLSNITSLMEYINEKKINYLQCTPSLADSLDFQLTDCVKMIAVAGEKIPESLFNKTYENNVKLINVYGQSEFHAGTAKIVESVSDLQNIGHSLEGMDAYVLDDNLEQVSEGETGEICLVGDQMAKGYLKLEKESKQHFIPNPFGRGVLCRTGDIVRKLEDGEFEFVGRKDFQLNINGIRIEPGEIEKNLEKIPEIEKSVVVGYDDQIIEAYYVSPKKLDEDYITKFLNGLLPEYMQPNIYMRIDQLPLNDNGKLDRSKLPKSRAIRANYQAPSTKTEKIVVSAVKNVLGIDKVGVLDSFFRLGGNSLKAIQLSNHLIHELHKKITTKEIFASQDIQSLANLLDTLQYYDEKPFLPAQTQKYYPMSPAQKRMFSIYEIDREDTTYHEQIVTDFTDRIDEKRLVEALEKMIKRHETLRTRFLNINGGYYQEVMLKNPLDFKIVNYTEKYSEFVSPMDLKQGQTMRVRLLRGQIHDSLLIDKHHIITDGMSEKIFYQELEKLYEGYNLDTPTMHYKDYSVWFNNLDVTKEKKWWDAYLADYQRLELVADKNIVERNIIFGRTLSKTLNQEFVNKLRSFAQNRQVSEYMVFFGAISILLSKMYYSDDFVLGTVSNGRVNEETENMLGMFVNTLPIRVKPSGNLTVENYLLILKNDLLMAISNQNYQFDEIVKDLRANNNGENPLFDCMFVYQNIMTDYSFAGKAKQNPYRTNASKFPLTFEVVDSSSILELHLNYNDSLFDNETIESLEKRLICLLEQMIEEPERKISKLSLLLENEQQSLIGCFENDSFVDVVSLFEKQVDMRPNDIALRFESKIYTYESLNEEVNKVANYLIDEMSVQSEQKIPLILGRSHKIVIAILAVLKSGAAYIPVSLKYPAERAQYILDACNADFVIDDAFMNQKFPNKVNNPDVNIMPNQLAYLIFTSGTTGKPKGVMVEHKNLSNFVVEVAKMHDSGMNAGVVNGAFFEYVFDSSIHDLIRPFTIGESVVILDTDLIYDIDMFIQTLNHYQINSIGLTPSLAAKVDLRKVPSLKFIHCGGEAITQEVIDKYADSSIQLNNCYGPTETTVLTFVNNNVTDLSIGYPIGGVNVYVLDDNRELLPQGAVGNLYIGGKQVTRGYINQPEETVKHYIKNPFGGGVVFDTGDLVRCLNNGSYQYFGRKDFQVKIRGYRVELGEIENKLTDIKGIEQSAIIVKKDNLIAYYVSRNEFDDNYLYENLAKTLPDYMLPMAYVHLEELPLTINGKLDVHSLPEPVYQQNYIAPKNKREKEIESAFCSVLSLDKVSVDANFFRLGGNSIKAISLASIINLPVKDIFEHKTISNLAKVSEQALQISPQVFRNVKEQNLSYAQKRLYFIDQLEGGTNAYNIPLLINLSKEVNIQKLEEAIQTVVERHEILRTIIVDSHQEVLNKKLEVTHDAIDSKEFFDYSFDLEKEMPIRVNIYNYQLTINIHHIAFDGWSSNIFLKEIVHLYNDEELSPKKIQYKDFAKWEASVLDEEYLKAKEEYWVDKLAGFETLDFPTDYSRPKQFDYEGQELDYKLKEESIRQLKNVAHEHNTSFFCVTLSAWQILLSSYCNQTDIVLGSPIANRGYRGTEDMIGCFVNTLALRTKIDTKKSFSELLEENTQQIIEAQAQQDLPFERLVNALGVEKDLSRNPIFQIMFSFQEIDTEIEKNSLFLSINDNLHLNTSKFDISVMLHQNILNFTYARKLFKKDTIQRIAETYEQILEQVMEDPKKKISEIILNPEVQEIESEEYPILPLHRLFEKQALLHPKSVAIVYDDKIMTYEKLNQEANRLAHTLIAEYGDLSKQHIPIFMKRSEKYLVAILGILKAGASYVPLSLDYPQERIDYIIEKVSAPFIITDNYKVLSNDLTNPNCLCSGKSLAYIIFTSGTTGKPKGVMIEHGSVVNTIYNQIEKFKLDHDTKTVLFADFVFDASVYELFCTLLAGAKGYLLDEQTRKDYRLLKQKIINNNITFALLPPAILNSEDLLPLETLIVGGESTPIEIYRAYSTSNTKIVNAYGPTEISICATMKSYEQGMSSQNIGKALKNVVTYVLDKDNHQVPTNGVGELCIGGAGLARGYIGEKEKTRNSFIIHPQFGRLYKTGDLVKRLTTGDLIYFGRNDFQVKVRGFRVELGEIESRLQEQSSISQSLAIVKGSNIIAYYKGKLQHTLEGVLPNYMLPTSYVKLESFPLTINGKIDLHKLPDPIIEQTEYTKPETKREKEIAAVFCELLDLAQVSVLDDFYKLGGNSILALKLASRINLPVKDIFEAKNIRNLAKLQQITIKVSKQYFSTPQEQVLSFAQERLWFIEQYEKGTSTYNGPIILELARGTSISKVEESLKEIVARHEVLRTKIKGNYQLVTPESINITHEDIELDRYINKVFDLENEIPIRANIYDSQLVIVIHHIAFDGWSTDLLLQELTKLYHDEELKPLDIQYKDFSRWQREYMANQSMTKQMDYWKETLDSYEQLNLPSDYERPKNFTYHGSDISIAFEEDLHNALDNLAKMHKTSLYTIMLSALNVMLSLFSYQEDIVIGSPFANRHFEGIEKLIGFFINTLPVRSSLNENMSFTSLVQRNHNTVLNIQNHQDIPFEQIVKGLKIPQDSSRNAIFQVLFSVQDFTSEVLFNNDVFEYLNTEVTCHWAKYDLSVMIENGKIAFNYCTDIYKKSTIQSMLDTYVAILKRIIIDDKLNIGQLVSSDVFSDGNEIQYPKKTIVDLFKEQVEKTPENIAIEYQNTQLTYKDFDILTNRFANYLLQNGIQPGDKVPLILERSEKMAIAIWGVLKAGCAYVPISPEFPDERKRFILEQIDAKCIIDKSFNVYVNAEDKKPTAAPAMTDLAYVIFTSGTTGNPKGVMIDHAGLSNRIQWMKNTYPINEGDKIYQKTNYVFDVSVWEHIWALLTGARIIYAIEGGHKDPVYLATEINNKKITVMHFVPSMLDAFLDTLEAYNNSSTKQMFDLSSLKYVFCSGEALKVNSVKKFRKHLPNVQLHNLYGPTEASIDVTYFDCNSPNLEQVLIGKPVSNMKCFVLSRSNQLLPKYAIGELALGGVQLSCGYINQPQLTAEKFIHHSKLGRIYKTGDLVRLLDNGEIEYLGRNDFQVKIHGLRIELGEIEKRLSELKGIKQAVVTTVGIYLVAYYLADRPLSEEYLKKNLELTLPDYMIPASFIFMKQFPITINGKLNRKALPKPTFETEEYVNPENLVEFQIQEIFSSVIGMPAKKISVEESFFHLGGDSIKAIQLSNRIMQKLNQTISIKEIFDLKTIRNISNQIGKVKNCEIVNEQGILTGEVKLLPIQKWFFDEVHSNDFCQAFGISLPTDIKLDRLRKALIKLVNYHDALRISFQGSKQEYSEEVHDVDILQAATPKEIKALQNSFSLDGKLYRFILNEQENVLIVICHHLIMDSVSWRILASDLKELYEGHQLPDKGTSYRQWSEKVNEERSEEGAIGCDYKNQTYERVDKSRKIVISLDRQNTMILLNKVNQVYNTHINDVLLTAFARALKSIHKSDISCIKLESHGRAEISKKINIQRTVGWFTTIYPQLISTNLIKTKHFDCQVKDNGIHYGTHNGIHSKDLPEITFNYLGQIDNGTITDWSIVPVGVEDRTDIRSRDLLTVSGFISQNRLTFELSGTIKGIDKLANNYNIELNNILKELSMLDRTFLTCDDIGCLISQKQLDVLQEKQELEDVISANSMQEGFIYQFLNNDSKDDAYVCSYIFDYEQPLNVENYKQAWFLAQKKYPSLRLSLVANDREMLQLIPKEGKLDFEFLAKADVDEVVRIERSKPFDLALGSLFRVRLIQYSESYYRCVLTIHHAIVDGWSNPLILNSVNEIYTKLCKSEKINNHEDTAYFASQRYLAQTKGTASDYWKNFLSEVSHPDLGGLFKQEQHSIKLEEVKRIEIPQSKIFQINGEDYFKLVDFSKKQGLTISIVSQYAWHKLLSVYGGIKETTVGVVNAGRNIPIDNVEDSVGLYIRTLPVQFFHTDEPILAQLHHLQDINNDCMTHNNVSLSGLQSNGTRIFETLFVYENYPIPSGNKGEDCLRITNFEGEEKLDYPITLILGEKEDSLQIEIKYAGELFADDTMDQLIKLYRRLINQIVIGTKKQTYVDSIPDFGVNHYPKKTIIEVFEEQVSLHPNSIALNFGEIKYSFWELNLKANQVSYTLVNKFGINPKDNVPLLLPKSEKMIVAILGVLKAGAVYVPMSPSYPLDRIEYIKHQVGAKITIDEAFMNQEFLMEVQNPKINIKANDLAYIIFTSGTTGRPKGVMVEHRNFLIYLEDILAAIKRTGTEEIEFGCIADYVFDIFGTEIFGQLLRGKSINLFVGEPEDFPRFMKEHHITVLQSTPGKISYLFQNNDEEILSTDLTTIMVGGEKMNAVFANRFRKINLINIYGPTEGTVWTSMKKVVNNYSNIGEPFPHYTHYILDENKKMLPYGAVGELYISGPQLSRGYYGQNDLTKLSFVDNPYNISELEEYSRMYKTGDIARVLPNREFELIGRNDLQVKIRGFRIELGEVENAMLKVDGVKQVLALAMGKEGSKYIGVYYQSEREITRTEIEMVLSRYLTDYMMPSGYRHVDEFPLTINGKIDRRALPKIIYDNGVRFVVPHNEVEKNVLRTICDILDLDFQKTSCLEDFFTIGGDSIKAVKLVNSLKSHFDQCITIKEIFEARTVEKIAKRIESNESFTETRKMVVSKQNFIDIKEQKLSYAQQQYAQVPSNSYSNVKIAFHIIEGVDKKKLEKAVIRMVERQEVLRTKIINDYQIVDEHELLVTHKQINREQYFGHIFDLETEIPIQVNIFEDEFTCVIDHIAFDGWSTSLFVEEIEKAYFNFPMPELSCQYKDFAKCQYDFLIGNGKDQQFEYWKEQYNSFTPLHLPTDFVKSKENHKGGDVYLNLDEALYNNLLINMKMHGATLHNVLLSAYYLTLATVCNQSSVSIIIPTVNRSTSGIENLIGLFINQFLLSMEIKPEQSFADFVQQLNNKIIESQNNQDIPFEELLKKFQINLDGSKVYFGIQGFKGEALKHSRLFSAISEMNEQIDKDAFCDLTIFVWGQTIDFNYDRSLFKRETIESFADIYQKIVTKISNNLDTKIYNLIEEKNLC